VYRNRKLRRESAARRLLVAEQDKVLVVDPAAGKVSEKKQAYRT
jgi:hypothetical protein